MTAFPADIQKAAAALYNRLGCGSVADEAAIAKALMAERERAAAIADLVAGDQHKGRPYEIGKAKRQAGSAIAAAIRSPQPSPTAGAST